MPRPHLEPSRIPAEMLEESTEWPFLARDSLDNCSSLHPAEREALVPYQLLEEEGAASKAPSSFSVLLPAGCNRFCHSLAPPLPSGTGWDRCPAQSRLGR